MVRQVLNIGTGVPGSGDPAPTFGTKVNANFTELYASTPGITGPTYFGTDSGVVNAYLFTHAGTVPVSLTKGSLISFTPLNTNTGAVTVNADGTGAVAAIRANGSALTGGEFSSLGPVVLQSTGTQWQIVSTAGAQPGFERTAAETSTGVIPANYGVYSHAQIAGFLHVDRYGINTTPGTTSMQSAFVNALAVAAQIGGGTITGFQTRYLVTGLTVNQGVTFDFFNTSGIYAPNTGAQIYSVSNAPIILNTTSQTYLGIKNVSIVGGGLQVTFTASVGGATSGTLTSNWLGANGTVAANFSDGESRTVTVTQNSAAVSWTGALSAGTILTAYFYQGIASQDGIQIQPTYPAQTTVRIQNVSIFNCGRYNFWLASSYGSSIEGLYSQAGANLSILDGPNCGGNDWRSVDAAASASGIDMESTNGTSHWNGLVCEQNNYGVIFESGCIQQVIRDIHTERNIQAPVFFKSGSNRNAVQFEIFGDSGVETAWPLNSGGNQNHVLGNHFGNSTTYDAKPIQRQFTNLTTNVNGAALTATPYSNAAPTNAQGLQVMSITYTPLMIGNRVKVKAMGWAECAGAGTMTCYFMRSTACLAAQAINVAAGVPAPFCLEYDFVTSGNGADTINFRVSSSTAADTVTVGGHAAANIYGGAAQVASMSVEEWLATV